MEKWNQRDKGCLSKRKFLMAWLPLQSIYLTALSRMQLTCSGNWPMQLGLRSICSINASTLLFALKIDYYTLFPSPSHIPSFIGTSCHLSNFFPSHSILHLAYLSSHPMSHSISHSTSHPLYRPINHFIFHLSSHLSDI